MKKTLLLAMLILASFSFAQNVKIFNLDLPTVNYRGLSVVDDYVFWVSGNKGTIGFSLNGGKTMNWVNPPGFENRDFRDIEAIDYKTAIAIAVGEPGLIIKTTDSGKNWKIVYQDIEPGVFLDDLDFSKHNPQVGIAMGDPINNQPYVLATSDAGSSWEKINPSEMPKLANGEAYFAASGSNVQLINDQLFIAVTGGEKSNIILNTQPPTIVNLPKSDSSTAGANGMDYWASSKFGLIVGGDFSNPELSEHNLFIFELNEFNQPIVTKPETAPRGYKSGVAILSQVSAVSCGLGGVDVSDDKGKNWRNLTKTEFNTCKRSKRGNAVYLVGPHGRIGRLNQN